MKFLVTLFFFNERLLRLIKAGWLINQMDNSKRLANLLVEHPNEKINMMDPVLYCRPVNLADAWDYFPRSLLIWQIILQANIP